MTDSGSESSFGRRLTRSRWQPLLQTLGRIELAALIAGLLAIVMDSGFGTTPLQQTGLSGVVITALVTVSILRAVRLALTLQKGRLLNSFYSAKLLLPVIWLVGLLLCVTGMVSSDEGSALAWAHICHGLISIAALLGGCRRLAAQTHNSAILLVASFLVVILAGTLLLRLPVCRSPAADGSPQTAEWNVALFTATSASCVTGLIVEPTGSYWSATGHAVIFALFQIGGLGILTVGAFIAVLSGRQGMHFREARTLREMLDSDSVNNSRSLLFTILLFTLVVELTGMLLMLSFWSDLGRGAQIWHALFHSVSAFCNAGFSLHDDGFLGKGSHWQIWGPLSWLIILGGLGFPVVQDVFAALRVRFTGIRRTSVGRAGRRRRLSLHSRLVLYSSFGLLAGGAVLWFLLESLAPAADSTAGERIADAWFQSVTFRTAGFNTVDHAQMHPATKLLAIFLMFIGAAPGSTGGGVKTIVFALTILNIRAVFRGRDRVEAFGRTVPAAQVSRALSMIAVGIFIVLTTTALLVIFEKQPERFLDHLFEATSAFATVGVSAGVTPDLTLPSRLLICLVMFLGRVGPITMLLAMASPGESTRFTYPDERVSLG